MSVFLKIGLFSFALLVATCASSEAEIKWHKPPEADEQKPSQNCALRSRVVDHLDSVYSERQSNIGMIGPRSVAEIWVSMDGTWTWLVTGPTGITCIVTSGTGWESLFPAFGDEEG